ncbi:metallophosphoesterase family protein [Nesterenkonia flava]|uniref:Metallophosphoesterase n=1 Tax=Nesterenkonia flava TaxID=469799 RepID=A0ABU1FPZ2_9MICC|nr:metallophosphoesterase [Nesterenkonia flava]MDR5710706.1 metallophosphoesterase [Nesterenkonia flava]
MSLSLLHLSDIHATLAGPLHGRVDGLARLTELRQQLTSAPVRIDAVIAPGDLIDRTSPEAMPAVLRALDQVAEDLGAPLIPVLGNHDVPAFDRLSGPLAAGHRSLMLGPLRIIVLNSSSGSLDEPQLNWLRQELSHGSVPEWGSVVCLHHSPLASPVPALRGKGLRNGHELAEVLTGSDVRLILTGHYHHVQAGALASVPV